MQNIKVMRERASLTQVELAKMLGVGQSTIAMWETGESAPRAALLPKIAELLKCSIDELFESDKQLKII
jgi:DNA-binding XRE family transcriptional regulator